LQRWPRIRWRRTFYAIRGLSGAAIFRNAP
jgi:hypothetical protein